MNMLPEDIKNEIVRYAQPNNFLFYAWNNHLAKRSIYYKQLDSDVLGIQLFVQHRDGFPVYERTKEALTTILAKYDIYFNNEIDLRPKKEGWFKELHFVKKHETDNASRGEFLPPTSNMPTVFISYNWGSEVFVDAIEAPLTGKAEVRRDKRDIKAWGSISDFMKSIRHQDFAVLVVSDAYLKSTACLYEVVQLMKDDGWADKTMNVVMDDAHGIYDPLKRADYIKFWDTKCKELGQKIKPLPPAATTDLIEELKKSNIILLNIGAFMAMVANANNPPVDKAISEILKRVSVDNKAVIAPVVGNSRPSLSPLPKIKPKIVKPQIEEEKQPVLPSTDQIEEKLSSSIKNCNKLKDTVSYSQWKILCAIAKLSGFGFSLESVSLSNLLFDVGKSQDSIESDLFQLLKLEYIYSDDGETFNLNGRAKTIVFGLAEKVSLELGSDSDIDFDEFMEELIG